MHFFRKLFEPCRKLLSMRGFSQDASSVLRGGRPYGFSFEKNPSFDTSFTVMNAKIRMIMTNAT